MGVAPGGDYMRTGMQVVMVSVLAAGLAVSAPAGVAVADPGDPDDSFELDCGPEGTFAVVTGRGNGEFTPAFDIASNKVFVPVVFGDFTGQITGPDGPMEPFTEPGGPAKGSGKQRNLVDCVFTFTDAFTVTPEEADSGDEADPEFLPAGDYVFEGGGTVSGQIRGR